MPQFLKAQDVASQLGKSLDYVKAHSRFNNPKLPILLAVKVLGKYRYAQGDVDKFIADNTKTKD
jgi:hypothetical protein